VFQIFRFYTLPFSMITAMVAIFSKSSTVTMIDSLFHIVVTGAAAVGSGIARQSGALLLNRILKIRAQCPGCGRKRSELMIRNTDTNYFRCLDCLSGIDQYTNATEHTQRPSGELLVARLSPPAWDEWGGAGKSPFSPECTLEVVEGRGESLVADLTLSRVFGDAFHTARIPVRTRGMRHTQSLGWSISPSVFPRDIDLFSVDVRVMNTYGDHLHTRRDLGKISFGT
jgi:hypothetical protein